MSRRICAFAALALALELAVPRSADARALPFAERPDLFQELHARADAAAAATADPAAVPAPRFAAFAAAAAACADAPAAAAVPGGGPPLPPAAVPRVWRSARPRAVDDVTLVTNLDRGRLAMLADQCATWGGPLSAAVYLALDARAPPAERAAAAAELAAELAALHAVAEARAAGCALDLALVTEERLAEEMWAYPYNTMRNQALARAATRLVLLLDADFLVSDGFRDEALRPAAWAALLDATHARRQALVLPAFETRAGLELGAGAATAAAAAAADKRGLKRMFDGGDVTRFAPFYRRGHSATDYARWFASAAGYEVVPETGYEPYLLLSRLHVPWFDERFRGYGWDKISHIYQMTHGLGFGLEAVPAGWVVHRPHAPSSAYNMTFTGPAYTTKHRPTEELRKLDAVARGMMAAVRGGRYPEAGVTALAACRPLGLLGLPPAAEAELRRGRPPGAARAAFVQPGRDWY